MCHILPKIIRKIQKDINAGFVKHYFKRNMGPVILKASKTAGGDTSRFTKKYVKVIEKKMPKTNDEIDEFINDGKKNEGLNFLQDIPVDVFDLERALKEHEYEGMFKKNFKIQKNFFYEIHILIENLKKTFFQSKMFYLIILKSYLFEN